MILKVNEKLLNKIKENDDKNNVTITIWRVLSGDIWNNKLDRMNNLHQNFSSSCKKIKLFSVYKIGIQENIPSPEIKIIPNNGVNGQPYDINFAKALNDLLYNIVQNLSKK